MSIDSDGAAPAAAAAAGASVMCPEHSQATSSISSEQFLIATGGSAAGVDGLGVATAAGHAALCDLLSKQAPYLLAVRAAQGLGLGLGLGLTLLAVRAAQGLGLGLGLGLTLLAVRAAQVAIDFSSWLSTLALAKRPALS
jgi:hypothetical protein